jgi:4-hydroxy-3-polyprenylbenzoate decarboxylase
MDNQSSPTPSPQPDPLTKTAGGERKNVVLAITGASGAIFGLRMLRMLLVNEFNVDLILSEYGQYNLFKECNIDIRQPNATELFPDISTRSIIKMHSILDLKSEIFSVNYIVYGVIVCPCSMNFLSGIAHSACKNLIEKAADYAMSYSRPLIIVPRETPLNKIHLENMLIVIEAGGHILPAMPGFETNPQNFNDLADLIAARVLNLLTGNRTMSV